MFDRRGSSSALDQPVTVLVSTATAPFEKPLLAKTCALWRDLSQKPPRATQRVAVARSGMPKKGGLPHRTQRGNGPRGLTSWRCVSSVVRVKAEKAVTSATTPTRTRARKLIERCITWLEV